MPSLCTNCKYILFFWNRRWFRCPKEPRQYLHFGTGWSCRPKFAFLNYVPAANHWIAWSFSATKIGVVRRISWSNSTNSGILYGGFIVQSRHPCKDPANEKLPGFSSVIKTMLSDCAWKWRGFELKIQQSRNSLEKIYRSFRFLWRGSVRTYSGMPKRLLDGNYCLWDITYSLR